MNSKQETSKQIILVTGAACSGKSEWAETLASKTGKPVVYVATAQVDDADSEWCSRIDKHRRRRPSSWQTWSVPVALATAIERAVSPSCLLIDSLGTWVANELNQEAKIWDKTVAQLIESLKAAQVDIILVGEETGWGVVPAYQSGRQFRDRLGTLIRQIGTIADRVYLVTGGHVLDLSLLGQPLRTR